MKKILSMILTLVIVFSLTVPAMAITVNGNNSKEVKATYVPKYTVTVTGTTNGTVTPNVTKATAGTTITLTVSPAVNFELDQLIVKDSKENIVTLEPGYTFTMPDSNVTVTATFKQLAVPAHKITVDPAIQNGTVVPDKAEAKAGDTVTLTITPATGYEMEALTVGGIRVSDSAVSGGKYTFTMGNDDVSVTAAFTKINYTIAVNPMEHGSITVPATATYGETVTFTVNADMQYELSYILVQADNDEIIVISDKSFTMPASNVTITATFTILPIISAEITWGSMSFTYTDGVDEAPGAWTCDTDANKITVTNTGDRAFMASAAYTPEEGYTEILGKFYNDQDAEIFYKLLNPEEVWNCYLKLFNQPSKTLNNVKIGTVTITITE